MIGLVAVALATLALVCVIVSAGERVWLAVVGLLLGCAAAWVGYTNLPPVYGG